MIDLFYWPTPNGHKITIFLEETGLPYRLNPIDIGKGDQFKPDFLKIAPNNRMPAIIDDAPADGGAPLSVFESGAILTYLGEKTGKFLPLGREKYKVLEWLNWQMGGLGPMAGQNHHFAIYAPEKIPYAIERYVKETNRLYGVLDRQLAKMRDHGGFVAGDYSIADMACYPWVVPWKAQGQTLDDFPDLRRWFEAIRARPAVVRAYEIGDKIKPPQTTMSEEDKKVLFGQTAASVQPKMSAPDFASIRKQAEKRKGGAKALLELLPAQRGNAALANTPDDRVLAGMTQRIFCAGFVWRVIEQKWPGFEAAFEGFSPERLAFEPDEYWERLSSDQRIVRNGAKIAAVRENALFVARVSKEHGGFGKFLAEWPAEDEAGLLAFLAKNGARLGGMTGQYFLRFVGWDAFLLSRDVIAALRDAGLEISEKATSKRDMAVIQSCFAAWAKKTGLGYTQLSRICALSSGENFDARTILERMQGDE